MKSYINPQPYAVDRADKEVAKKKETNLAGSEMDKTKKEKKAKLESRNK